MSPEILKQTMKEVLLETLTENRELLIDVLAEVLEDFALVKAIEEGRQTEQVERSQVFDILEN